MTSSRAARRLARLSGAILPLQGDIDQRTKLAAEFLDGVPRAAAWVLRLVSLLFWLLGVVWRRGAPTVDAAMALWVERALASRRFLVRKIGDLMRIVACNIVLGEQAPRERLFTSLGLEAPSRALGPDTPAPATARPKSGRFADVADYIVVGSGPAGATVARALAREGKEVILLEEGPTISPTWGSDTTIEVACKRLRSAGLLTSGGPERAAVLQGIGVGGSSVINSAIAWRAPDDVFSAWHVDSGLERELPIARMHQLYDELEQALGVEETPRAIYGGNNALMDQAAAKMGIEAEPTRRYTKGCEGLGRCLEGCPKGRKLSMNATFIPDALAAGARLFSDCRVEKIDFIGRNASSVRARMQGKPVRFAARKAIIVAASAVQTPLILGASGLRHRNLGRRFQAHPGASMAAVFDGPVRSPMVGATQGYNSIHFRKTDSYKLETITLPEELLATRMPGAGHNLAAEVEQLPNTALWATQVRAVAHGRVGGSLSAPAVTFHFERKDCATLAKSLRTIAEMFFAAGARYVMPHIAGLPERIHDPSGLDVFGESLHPKRMNTILSHMFGTTVMGSDDKHCVCDPNGKVYGTDNVYVADSSLFPTNMGVNPQHTIMALAQHVAERVVG